VVEVVRDGETGLLVPHGDASALAERALTLLGAPDRARALGREGRRIALHRFDLRSMVRRTESVYEELLREKGLVAASV
jgi:glycosyltransferase involved in cell wall biosynthesis